MQHFVFHPPRGPPKSRCPRVVRELRSPLTTISSTTVNRLRKKSALLVLITFPSIPHPSSRPARRQARRRRKGNSRELELFLSLKRDGFKKVPLPLVCAAGKRTIRGVLLSRNTLFTRRVTKEQLCHLKRAAALNEGRQSILPTRPGA